MKPTRLNLAALAQTGFFYCPTVKLELDQAELEFLGLAKPTPKGWHGRSSG